MTLRDLPVIIVVGLVCAGLAIWLSMMDWTRPDCEQTERRPVNLYVIVERMER